MQFYRLLKTFSLIRSPWARFLVIYVLYLLRRRYLGVYLDPTEACNLRCRMCYFSGEEHGTAPRMKIEEYQDVVRALFYRTLKLQIGCGAEPTIHPQLPQMVRMAKEAGVPFVSVTTNGLLLARQQGKMLRELGEGGLDELIISLHGTERSTYETMMTGASFDTFLSLLAHIRQLQAEHCHMSLRINYTMNADNFLQLRRLPELLRGVKVSTIQVRPIQNLGYDAAYTNFDVQPILEAYDQVFPQLLQWVEAEGILFLYPTKDDLHILAEETHTANVSFQHFTYINVRPGFVWHPDFDPVRDTFDTYARRTGYGARIRSALIQLGRPDKKEFHTTMPLNYHVK